MAINQLCDPLQSVLSQNETGTKIFGMFGYAFQRKPKPRTPNVWLQKKQVISVWPPYGFRIISVWFPYGNSMRRVWGEYEKSMPTVSA